MELSLVIAGMLAGVSLGGIVFTSLLVAPIIFIVLEPEAARDFTRTMWPRYFLAHAVLGGAVAGFVIYGADGFTGTVVASAGTGLLMAINYGIARLLSRLRGSVPREETDDSYAWMHRLTVWLNWVCLLLMAGVLYQLLRWGTTAIV